MHKYHKLEELVDEDSFVRWIRGEANPEEIRYWQHWLNSDPNNRVLFNDAKILLQELNASRPATSDTKIELRRLHQSVAEYERQRREKNLIYGGYLPTFARIAAGLLLLIGTLATLYYFVWRNNSRDYLSANGQNNAAESFQTGYGQMATLRLGDGSMIVLNAHTRLKISSTSKGERNINVWLQGEAYFDIPHFSGNRRRLLTVHTSSGTITDLGTRFVVKSRSDTTQVVLAEGRVRVSAGKDSLRESRLNSYTMKPGEMARFSNDTDRVTIEPKVNVEVYTSWKDHKLVFDRTPMVRVAKRVEETYGVNVIIADKSLRNRLLSGSINNKDLEILKKALSHALNVPVHQTGNTVRIGLVH